MFKNTKGITLISLIVTIIILLILAGISIASLTGSGLFSKAQQAKQEQENAIIKEGGILANYEDIINGYLSGTTRDDGSVSKEQYEELVSRLTALENDYSITKQELQNTKTELQESNEKIDVLENSGIKGLRVSLLNNPVSIPVSDTDTGRNIDIKLTDSVENYKILEIHTDLATTGGLLAWNKINYISKEQLSYNNSNTINQSNDSEFDFELVNTGPNSWVSIVCWLKDETTFHIGMGTKMEAKTYSHARITNIYGIK